MKTVLPSVAFLCFHIIFCHFVLADEPSLLKETPLGMVDESTHERILQVELMVVAPFSIAQITIFADGYLRYEATAPGSNIHQHTKKNLKKEDVEGLFKLIRENHFESLKNSPTAPMPDATVYTITISYEAPVLTSLTAQDIHHISCTNTCPQEITEIIATIKKLFGQTILEIGV